MIQRDKEEYNLDVYLDIPRTSLEKHFLIQILILRSINQNRVYRNIFLCYNRQQKLQTSFENAYCTVLYILGSTGMQYTGCYKRDRSVESVDLLQDAKNFLYWPRERIKTPRNKKIHKMQQGRLLQPCNEKRGLQTAILDHLK